MDGQRFKFIKLLFISLALIAAISLGACSSDDDKDKADKPETDKEEKAALAHLPPPICPQVAIVRELQTVQDYGREAAEPGQLVFSGRLNNVQGDCAYTDDGIDVKFTLAYAAQRGPKLGGRHVDLPYFIAVLDPKENILNKNTLSLSVDFSGDKTRKEDEDDLHVFIPLPKKQQRTGPNYQVLIGFQLTEDQLKTARDLSQK